jgi:uncharacterized membrane protein HdeD (DUF308 family)
MIISNPFATRAVTQEQVNNVGRRWWVLFTTGIISVLAGGIILFTDWTVGDLAAFLGALLVIRGIFMSLSVPIDGAGRGWSIGLGLLEVGVGLAVWTWPGATLLVVAFFIGWWVLFSGIMTIAGAISGRNVLANSGLTLAWGILETLLSIWLLARPGLTLVAAVLSIGFWSVFYGVMQIVLALQLRKLSPGKQHLPVEERAVTSPRPFDDVSESERV